MKKICFFKIILFLITILLLPIGGRIVYAADTNDSQMDESYNQNKEELQGLYDYINKMGSDSELISKINPESFVKTFILNGNGNLSFDTILSIIIKVTFKELSGVLYFAISIIVIGIICALLKNLQDSFSSKAIADISFYGCYAILIILISNSFLIAVNICKDTINGLSNFMAAILPVLVTMIAASGGVTQSMTLDPVIMWTVVLIPRVYLTVIIPLVLTNFVLQFANNLSNEHKITNLCKMLKQFTLWIQGIIITSFIAILTVRGITSSTLDAVALKTTKFAVDNFIPIVGKSFSDAITSVAGYSLIIKNAVSSMGLIVIILYILYPIIKIVMISFIYKFSAAIVEPICDKRITDLISSSAESLTVILSCVLSISLMFFIFIAILASSGKFVLGA